MILGLQKQYKAFVDAAIKSQVKKNIVKVLYQIKYIETPCEALPARLSQLQTSITICLSKKSTRFVEARSKKQSAAKRFDML